MNNKRARGVKGSSYCSIVESELQLLNFEFLNRFQTKTSQTHKRNSFYSEFGEPLQSLNFGTSKHDIL